jgi:arginine decarboxylase
MNFKKKLKNTNKRIKNLSGGSREKQGKSCLQLMIRKAMVPSKMFFTKGVGVAKQQLMSFEMALRDAGIEKFNLVSVSSILPPGCQRVTKEKGIEMLKPGEIVYVVMARNSTNEPNRLVAASIGCAVPTDKAGQYGYLSEHHPFGETDEKTSDFAEDLAATMLATTLGVDFDPNTAWDEREKVYKLSGKIVTTTNITQSAQGNKDGLWTTVLSAAIFIP